MQERANRLVKMLCNDAKFHEDETGRALFVGELESESLLARRNSGIGVYLLREGLHGSPTLLLGEYEVAFRSLEFARACRSAYIEFHHHLVSPQILQVVE